METSQLEYALKLWDQAVERPYEVLIEEGLYDQFIEVLQTQQYILQNNIFRGTVRHWELKEGDKLEYKYPTTK